MKTQNIIILTAIILAKVFVQTNTFAQKSVTFFTGLNLTSTNYSLFINGNLDTASYTKDKIILPSVGFNYRVPIFNKLYITTGLGLSYMGNAYYFDKVDTTVITYPGVVDYIKYNPHFKIGYLRIPAVFEYKIHKVLYPFVGYSFNYSIRKNQNFWAAEIGDINSIRNIYSNYHHALLFGLTYKLKNIEFTVNYHKGISRIWDTKDYKPDKRAYLTLSGIQFSIGYNISD